MLKLLGFVLTLTPILLLVSAVPTDDKEPRAECTVTSYDDVAGAVSNCSDIVIDGISVPGGQTLTLNLNDGATLTFKGTITFGYKEWTGPLLDIQGNRITVEGALGSILDGQGPLYWDSTGSGGKTKPKFIRIKGTESQINNINVLNCPVHCVSILNSEILTLSGWNIDVSAGDAGGAHNTDGFDVSSSSNVIIKDSIVKNQDDCVALNQGTDFTISGLHCSGSHGLSISVGFSNTSEEANTLSNVIFSDCTVTDANNGIHVKTHINAGIGSVKNITYKNIILSGIRKYGINVQEDYNHAGGTGHPKVSNLQMIDVRGTMASGTPVYILCGDDGCSDWSWSEISISGGAKPNSCNFTPQGFTC